MKVVLELQDQPANVRRVMVRHDIVIGRGSDCNLRLSAPQVSRRHCFLRVGRDAVSVTDLDSSNGTYVNGQRIKSGKRYDLTNGATLSIGPVRFLIQIREEAVSADILQAGNLNQVIRATSAKSSDTSTIVDDASAIVIGAQESRSRPLDLSVEQAGLAADANEATADFQNGNKDPQSNAGRASRAVEEDPMDSRAEIIDLGRRMAALDDVPHGDANLDWDSRSPQVESQPSAAANKERADLVKPEFDENVLPQAADSAAAEEVRDGEEVRDEERFEELSDVHAETAGDSGAADETKELAENNDASWFDAASNDDDDIDPNLKDFLKGF